MTIDLRPYQVHAIEQAREAIRAGAKNVLIVAPTGSGKTVLASHLIAESQGKGRRSAFVVDRLSLINQTSETFDRYGIEHGIIQSSHPRFHPSLPVQICSIQTVARRRWPEAQLIVVDEAHTVTETVKKRIEPRNTIMRRANATRGPEARRASARIGAAKRKKLSIEQVLVVRHNATLPAGQRKKQRDLAAEFGVTQGTVCDILAGRCYADVGCTL